MLTPNPRPEYIANLANVHVECVEEVSAVEVRRALSGKLPVDVIEVATQEPARYYRVSGSVVTHWLDDPMYGEPCPIENMAMDPQLGLVVKDQPQVTSEPQPAANPGIETREDDQVFKAFLAINHYISTSEYVGVGAAMDEPGGTLALCVPFRYREWEDKDNWERLKAKIDQMTANGWHVQATVEPITTPNEMKIGVIRVLRREINEFFQEVTRAPGPKGWGSMFTFLQENNLAQFDPTDPRNQE